MTQTNDPVSITAHRPCPNVVEYSVTTHDPLYGDSTRTYHANRVATFMGPHTGGTANQLHGGARTLWREDDAEMARAFRREYPSIRDFSPTRIEAIERNASPLRRVNLDGCDLRFVDMAKVRASQ